MLSNTLTILAFLAIYLTAIGLFGAWAANGRGLRLFIGTIISFAIPGGFVPFAIGALVRRLQLRRAR